MDFRSHLDLLARHPYAIVFWSSLVEAAGIPFPRRVILILTPAFLTTDRDLVGLIVVARRRAARDGRTERRTARRSRSSSSGCGAGPS
jgi:hypothetical protein